MTRTNRVLNGFAKAGFHSGRLHAKNILAGRVDITLTSGDGTATVTFAKPMRSADYLVLVCPQESTTNNDLCLGVYSKSPQSFIIKATSTNHSTPLTVGFLVLDSRGSGAIGHRSARFGFHSGYAHFRNLQWGSARITIDGSGHGTALTVTLPHPMRNRPLVFASIDDDTAATAGFVHIATGGAQTNGSFILDCTGVTGPTTNVDITWVAFDPGFSFSTSDAVGNAGSTGRTIKGKFGIHSGNFRAINFLGGLVALTSDSNGDGSEAVTFGQMMRMTPICFVMIQSPVNDTTAVAYASSPAITGFTPGVNNSATVSDSVYLGYLCIDAEWLPTKAPESEMVA